MDLLDDVGPRQVQQVGVALELPLVLAETVAAEGRVVEAVSLDSGAHRAVEDQDPLREQSLQPVPCLVHAPTLQARRPTLTNGHGLRDFSRDGAPSGSLQRMAKTGVDIISAVSGARRGRGSGGREPPVAKAARGRPLPRAPVPGLGGT